ncbi:MAG: penicillin-binding transpeptidase domain-containing protein, partial [Negativicutes bacterium]|nr:penicillin-binding transpeptidase domain-containing protein [Negativicutes bacterium]
TYSYNVPVVILTNKLGPEKVINYARSLGITSLVTSGPQNDNNLAIALGGLTRGVTPLQMASAYGVMANMGVSVPATPIVKVIDRHGKVLEQTVVREQTVVNPKAVYTLVDMMKNVVERGTGTRANIGRPVAGKTGTTSDYRDAWFVGFTPDLSCAVWMGCDAGEELDGVTGGDLPAAVWRKFMSQVVSKFPNRDFPRPDGAYVPAEIAPEPPAGEEDKNKKGTDGQPARPGEPAKPNPPSQPPKPPATDVTPAPPPPGPATPAQPAAPAATGGGNTPRKQP